MSAFLIDSPTGFYSVSGIWGAAIPNGAYSVSYPLASQNSYARLYTQPFLVHSGADVSGVIGSAGLFAGTSLVEESERVPVGGGLYAFNRVYSETPSGFNDFETITYTFPSLTTYRPLQMTQTVVARVYNDFILTSNPQAITLSGATRIVNVYGWDVTEVGAGAVTTPNIPLYSGWVGSGVEMIASQATLDRYMGNVWRRQTPYVRAL